jgi:hypothetical protein
MGQLTTRILLPQTAYNGKNTQIFGDKVPAAGYFKASNQQTFTWSLASVSALITLQGSIVSDPTEADWVTLYNISGNNLTQSSFTTVSANLVWVRVFVTRFNNGVINNIKVSY